MTTTDLICLFGEEDYAPEMDYLLSTIDLRLRALEELALPGERPRIQQALVALHSLNVVEPVTARMELIDYYDDYLMLVDVRRNPQDHSHAELVRCRKALTMLMDAIKDWQRAVNYVEAFAEEREARNK